VLIVDEDDVRRSLLSRAFMRRFPTALVQQCGQLGTACFAVTNPHLTTAIVGGAAGSSSPLQVVAEMRAANAEVPILFVSRNATMRRAALEAGASHVIQADNWLRVPDIVATIVRWSIRHSDTDEVELIESAKAM
jgi:ActR/RegA family two-component response regulator